MKKQYEAYINQCKKNKIALTLTENDFLSIKSLKDLVNCSFIKVGHSCVIKALLQGDLEVVNNEVFDNVGLLE